MTSLSRDDMKLAEDAGEWVVRIALEPTLESREALVAWLQRSPRHIEEFLYAQTTYRLFHRIDPEREIDVQEWVANAKSSVVPFRQIGTEFDPHAAVPMSRSPVSEEAPSSSDTAMRDQSARPRWRIAAATAVAAIGLAVIWRIANDPDRQTYSTGLGEQRTVRLSDGSLIELNSRSKVEVRFSKGVRHVQLVAGEALFIVSHDEHRPFRVSTDTTTIQAVGTQFDVYRAETATRVAVVEGRIQVTSDRADSSTPPRSNGTEALDPPGHVDRTSVAPTLLAAGEQASVSGDGTVVKKVKPDVSSAVAWRQRRLVFDHTPLPEAIKELSRYSDFHIGLVGDDLLKRKISGVFQADDPQTIVSLFQADPTVRIEHVSNGVIITLMN
jgi:transmembrane sensor